MEVGSTPKWTHAAARLVQTSGTPVTDAPESCIQSSPRYPGRTRMTFAISSRIGDPSTSASMSQRVGQRHLTDGREVRQVTGRRPVRIGCEPQQVLHMVVGGDVSVPDDNRAVKRLVDPVDDSHSSQCRSRLHGQQREQPSSRMSCPRLSPYLSISPRPKARRRPGRNSRRVSSAPRYLCGRGANWSKESGCCWWENQGGPGTCVPGSVAGIRSRAERPSSARRRKPHVVTGRESLTHDADRTPRRSTAARRYATRATPGRGLEGWDVADVSVT